MKSNLSFCFAMLLIACGDACAQFQKYAYKTPIEGVDSQWHEIKIPETAFGKMAADFSDLRIYGILQTNDTIEAPYILRISKEQVIEDAVNFKIVNTSHNEKGHYYTFEIPAKATINQIELRFKQQNFDWKVSLEGSQDQQSWFTIVDAYRILSLNNDLIHFEHSKIAFPNSNYNFFRLFIPEKENPGLLEARIINHRETRAVYNSFPIRKMRTLGNKTNHQTVIIAELKSPVPISYLKINVGNSYDYYRPTTIEYVTDSIRTEKGWEYNYQPLSSGTLNSLKGNEFKFGSTLLKKFKVTIENADNQPLKIQSLEAKGYEHKVVARFIDAADYFLVYGNKEAAAPQYDIVQFTDKIPRVLTRLKLGKEHRISTRETIAGKPLFENKIWLWLVMTAIILILGGFSLSMIRKQ